MPFAYEPPCTNELRQGELIGPLYEHHVRYAAVAIANAAPVVESERHDRVFVITSDCDLLKDWSARRSDLPNQADFVSGVLLCVAHTRDNLVTPTQFGQREWRRLDRNQDERFHCLPEASVRDSGQPVPALYVDFKRTFMVRPDLIYQGFEAGDPILRIGCIGPVYLQDLIHRLFGFLSRVSPDFP